MFCREKFYVQVSWKSGVTKVKQVLLFLTAGLLSTLVSNVHAESP